MKYLKVYEDHSDIDTICQYLNIKNYQINQDSTIDVDEMVNIKYKSYKPYYGENLPLKFGKVNGEFTCIDLGLTSLKGCPVQCNGNFYCYKNKLTSIEFSPLIVNGNFDCGNNLITSLKGGPKQVSGPTYNFEENHIHELEGFPKKFNFERGNVLSRVNPVHSIINIAFPDSQTFIKYLIEFDVVRGWDIIELRLEQAYYTTTGKKLSISKKNQILDDNKNTYNFI